MNEMRTVIIGIVWDTIQRTDNGLFTYRFSTTYKGNGTYETREYYEEPFHDATISIVFQPFLVTL